MTNELIVVEFVCIFLLKDKSIDKSAWVVDMKVETTKMLDIVGTSSSSFPISLLTYTLTSLNRENFEYEHNYVFNKLKSY